MTIIYVTDLHGSWWKYERLFELAREMAADIVINGGDALPFGGALKKQSQFIVEYLGPYFKKLESAGIYYLGCLGNDDLRIFDSLYEATCGKYAFVKDLAQKRVEIGGYEFIGMNWVADYPFQLKDRCRMDTRDFIFPQQHGRGVLSTEDGLAYIDDWFSYALTLATLQDELGQLVKPTDFRRSIYVMHMPPAFVGLDCCSDGREVGSIAVYRFLETHQPLLSLHGHIHESPLMTGSWFNKIGDTLSIQPGQLRDFTYVTIDLPSLKIDRHTENHPPMPI